MSFTTVFNVDFTADADAPAGAAKTTTGAGHGIIDYPGSTVSRFGGRLVVSPVPSSPSAPYYNTALIPGTDAQTDQYIEVLWPVDRPAKSDLILKLRCIGNTPTSPAFYANIYFEWSFYNQKIATLSKGAGQEDIATLSFPGYSDSTSYRVRLTVTGTNPTTCLVEFRDASGTTVLASASGTTSLADVQAAGLAAIGNVFYGGGGEADTTKVQSLTVGLQSATPPLVPGLPTVSIQSSTSVTLTSAATGGTTPYARQWHRVADSIDWTPASGTLISGATATPLTNAVIAGTLYCYREVVTDSTARTPQVATSSPILVVSPFASTPTPRSLPNGVILIGLGDSMTASGVALARYATLLGNAGFSVWTDIEAHGGAASAEFDPDTDPSGHIANAIAKTNTLLTAHPGALVVWSAMLGSNDWNLYTPTQTAAVMSRLAAVAIAQGWLIEFKCPPVFSPPLSYLGAIEKTIQYRGLLANLANGTTIFNGDRRFIAESSQHPERYADYVHANGDGYTAMGEAWYVGAQQGWLAQPEDLDSSSSSSESSHSSASSNSSSSSSEPEEEALPHLHPNEARNTFPALFLNDDEPGLITKVDESAYRYATFPTLRGPVTVEMETPYANSEIRYSLNGKSPTPHSNLYVGPVVFKQNATGEKTAIRARIYDKRNSNVKSRIIRLEFRVIPR